MQENINIPDSTITTNLSFRQLVLMNMQQLTNFPYIEKDFDALTDYELLCLVVKYLNDVIANQNEQNDSITRMYESFLALQEYVNNTKDTLEDAFNSLDDYVRNYFANLDVQDEINNKLDDMAESGQLTDIIAQYLGLAGMIVYDTVSDMKQATNLVNGSKCHTLGFYEVNDSGDAIYKIRTKTNDDVIDESFIIALYDNNLVAELIIEEDIDSKQLGIYGDGVHDDTLKLNAAINKLSHLNIIDGDYLISDTIVIDTGKTINAKGKFIYNGERTKPAILIKGKYNEIHLNDIVDVDSANDPTYDGGWHGWSDANYSGIECEDVSYSNISFNIIANFTTGLKIHGKTTAGTYKTDITGYMVYNCKYGIYFKSLANTWVNNNKINKIMINYGSQSNPFHTASNDIPSYGVYQENVVGDTYGIRYMEFNNLFFETAIKDNFTAFYFNLIANSNFNMCIPETKNNSVYALFDMKYIVENPVSPKNHSYQNIFNNCYVMGGNNTITYNNTSKIVCSLVDVAKHSDIILNKIYEENNLLGKMVKIDNNHMSIKGYAFAAINATATNINTCQESKSNYSYITNQWDENCLNIGATTPLTMILPCSLNDTFKIVLNEKGNSGSTNGSIAFKVFDSTGAILSDPSNYEKALGGYLSYVSATKNYSALAGQLNDVEISVLDSNVAYILVYISGYVNGFNIYKYGKPIIAKKFGDNLKHLNILGDVAFSGVKPTSAADTESVIKNQRVYNSNSANLGEYWTFDGTSWS